MNKTKACTSIFPQIDVISSLSAHYHKYRFSPAILHHSNFPPSLNRATKKNDFSSSKGGKKKLVNDEDRKNVVKLKEGNR